MRLLTLAVACAVASLSFASSAWAQQEGPTPTIINATELVFTPIPPCRAFVTSTALAANQARTFAVSGTRSEFVEQGGPSAGCGLPASAAAVAISVTSFASTGTGHLRAAAFGDPITGTQVLSFRTGVTETASVIAAVKSRKLTLKAYTAATRIAGDITGYFAPQIRASVDSSGAVVSKTPRIQSTFKSSSNPPSYTVYVDRPVDQCTITGSTNQYDTVFYSSISPNGRSQILIYIYNSISGTTTSAGFDVLVTC